MPIYSTPPSFPGISKLPSPLKGLTEAIFPQTPGGVESIAPTPMMAANTVLSPPAEALMGLLKKFTTTFAPMKERALQAFSGERLSTLVPSPSKLKVPKGFALSESFNEAPVSGIKEGGFGQSPENAYRRTQQQRSIQYAKGTKPTSPLRATSPADAVNVSKAAPTTPTPRPTQRPLMGKTQSGKLSVAVGANSKSKLNPDMVKEIRKLHDAGMKLEDVAKKYPKHNKETIRSAATRATWTWVKD